MGAWGAGSFENDAACDWLAQLVDEGKPYGVLEALDRVLSRNVAEVSSGEFCEAIAAAEVVANWAAPDFPSPVKDQHHEPPSAGALHLCQADLTRAALAVIAIAQRRGSELAALWQESGEADDWLDSLGDLERRLRKS